MFLGRTAGAGACSDVNSSFGFTLKRICATNTYSAYVSANDRSILELRNSDSGDNDIQSSMLSWHKNLFSTSLGSSY